MKTQNNKIKLSVIVPVFNEEQSIGRVIEDLKKELGQIGLEHEIIVVNDNSK